MPREDATAEDTSVFRQAPTSRDWAAELAPSAPLEQPPLSFKEMLLSIPDVGEDSDFARIQDPTPALPR